MINTPKSNILLVLMKQREVFTDVHNIDVYLGVDRLKQLSCLVSLDYLAHLAGCFYCFQTKPLEECSCNACIDISLSKYSSTAIRLCYHHMGIYRPA